MGFIQRNPTLGKQEKGIAMLEFAIALPFLILLLAITGEIGYLLYQQSNLNKLIENGAIFAAKNTRLGSGLVKIDAQTLQETRNLVTYGNINGAGDKLIDSINPSDINLDCTYGTSDGFCEASDGISAITIKASVVYAPVLGSLFHNVTGFTLFPLTLSATSVVVPI